MLQPNVTTVFYSSTPQITPNLAKLGQNCPKWLKTHLKLLKIFPKLLKTVKKLVHICWMKLKNVGNNVKFAKLSQSISKMTQILSINDWTSPKITHNLGKMGQKIIPKLAKNFQNDLDCSQIVKFVGYYSKFIQNNSKMVKMS